MSEENEKKIDYKILTAEHLISEKEAEQKETTLPKQESFEPEVVKKIESPSSQVETAPSAGVSPEMTTIETKTESGVIHPAAEEIPLASVTFEPSQPEPKPKQLPEEQQPAIELPSFKPETFVAPKEESAVSPSQEVKPKFEILKTDELVEGGKMTETVAKQGFRLPLKLVLVPVGVVILGFALFWLKPQKFFATKSQKSNIMPSITTSERLALKLPELKTTSQPLIIITSSLVQETTSENKLVSTATGKTIITTTVTTSVAPILTKTTIAPATSAIASTVATKTTTTATTSKISTTSKEKTSTLAVSTTSKTSTTTTTTGKTISTLTSKTASTEKQTLTTKTQTTTTKLAVTPKTSPTSTSPATPTLTSYFGANGELIYLASALEKDLPLKTLTLEELSNQLKSFFIWQYFYQTLVSLKITYANKIISPDLVFNYFFKPSKLNQTSVEKFKQNLTNKFAFLIYYGYARKYPIIIFETKNTKSAKDFNNQWMKNGMSQDLKTLFLGIDPGKEISKFTSKKYNKFSYNIIYFEKNFQLIWSIVDNYLIYSSNEESLDQIINDLKK